jgi:hypothetical protein
LEADALSLKREQLALSQYQEDLRLIRKFDQPKQMRLLQSKVEQAKAELDRLKQRTSNEIAQAEADLKTSQGAIEVLDQSLQTQRRRLENTKIFAPQNGLVVYAPVSPFRWWVAVTDDVRKDDSVAATGETGNFEAGAGAAADQIRRIVLPCPRWRRQWLPATSALLQPLAECPSPTRARQEPPREPVAPPVERLRVAVAPAAAQDKTPAVVPRRLPHILQCGPVRQSAHPALQIRRPAAPVRVRRVRCFQPALKVAPSASATNSLPVRARRISATSVDLNTARPGFSKKESWFARGRS